MARNFEAALADAATAVQSFLAAEIHTPLNVTLGEAMRYAVVGGKGLRGFLAMESARLHGVPALQAVMPAAAIECLHAYSLVHDDLPCMDDDDLRRGQPTVHKKWDEATAVLAGDALHAKAFELLARADFSEKTQVALLWSLARAAGGQGMVGGQAADIAAESAADPLDLDGIMALQKGKTGELITWSCLVGPIIADASLTPLRTYGDALGLAFQITDDILDVEGDAATVGKAVSKDEAAGKATFVSLLGLDGAKRRAAELVESAQDALSPYGKDADTLRAAAQFVLHRKK
ncbi:farnesyl diphosphate synthase [Cognatiyoonia koreensis]|uniref:Geranylgeranyl diphosphate synthase n=1 Tax=Cognatiyoonia koreensis TaxID=364200 RepID=A0A1I0RKY8_9RHOB|nr:farnesyl diphosphate synthase [Cognatiyoonia koreensis]SEW41778.1 farnesyl diphosphate synthase [Cognatiyoonia koreensis]